MNNSGVITTRQRTRTLLIVEGHHEKEKLFWLLLKCFPEINIKFEDILIYGTNIYDLYQHIVGEYGENWDDGSYDVDLPHIVSKKQNICPVLNKRDFTNIILIFDYDRHDPNFSEDNLTRLQNYFAEASEEGQLYINYPMIESYQHISGIPDSDFEELQISVTLQPGQKYKNMTKDTFVSRLVQLPQKMFEILNDRFKLDDEGLCKRCIEALLNIKSTNNLLEQIEGILQVGLNGSHLVTARYQMADLIQRTGFAALGLTYYEYARYVLNQIILHNIRKSNKLQNGIYDINNDEYRDTFLSIDWSKILDIQNSASRDPVIGIIWVLNTCVTFVPEYNFGLLSLD